MRRVLGGWVKKLRELSTNGQLQNSEGDIEYNTDNIASNIVIALYGDQWVLEPPGTITL